MLVGLHRKRRNGVEAGATKSAASRLIVPPNLVTHRDCATTAKIPANGGKAAKDSLQLRRIAMLNPPPPQKNSSKTQLPHRMLNLSKQLAHIATQNLFATEAATTTKAKFWA